MDSLLHEMSSERKIYESSFRKSCSELYGFPEDNYSNFDLFVWKFKMIKPVTFLESNVENQ